ncbi:hypothetical protein QUF80_17400 [Desulfococcaceae bacterium HSG8]|nr:hypothetical protein [Desulfococcaceae bacterium HSG8]
MKIINKIRVMESSVRKWDKIIAGKGSDGGVLDCPPCRIYYMLICVGCPIAEYTGKKFCKGSPYVPWYWHQTEVHGHIRKKIYCPECLKLAQDMRDFMAEIVEHMKEKEKKEQKV